MNNRIPIDVISKEEQNKIITNNLDLPQILASITIRNQKNRKVDFNTLVSAGNEGLIEGAKRWDPAKSANARTYMGFWVSAKIKEEIYKNRNVHIPASRINEAIHSDVKVPQEISLNHSDNSDDGSSISADKNQYKFLKENDIFPDVESQETHDSLSYVLENVSLSSIEHQTLVHRFGLNGEQPKTLREISSMLDYTTMGIQKIEKRALKKIRESKEFQSIFC